MDDFVGGVEMERPRTSGSGHRPDLAALRVFAMLMVVVAHSAEVFTPWISWHVQNDTRSVVLGEVGVFIWPWVMPLFMFLAGAGGHYSIARRGGRGYAMERTRRLVLPFLVGTLLLIPPQIYLERLAEGRFDGSLAAFYPRFFECCYPEGNLAAGHLWFIAYLWVYSVAALPVLQWLKKPESERWRRRLVSVCVRPGGLLLLATPIMVSQVVLRGRYPQSYALFDDWSAHALLLSAFIYGYLFIEEPALARALDGQWRALVVPAGVASLWLGYAVATSTNADGLPPVSTRGYVVFWSMFGISAWSWVLVLAGAARSLSSAGIRAVGGLSGSVYPVYIVHQTAIVAVAYVVVGWSVGVAAKFVAVLVIGSAVTIVGAYLLERAAVVFRVYRGWFGATASGAAGRAGSGS